MRHALLLAGGQGKRFWPRSRRSRPKQFVAFEGDRSLLRATAERLVPAIPWERQWVVTHRDYVARVREELPELRPEHVLGEPAPRNTAPAIGLAAQRMLAEDPRAVMVVQAADHWIGNPDRFRQLVGASFDRVEGTGGALLIGFEPTRPATGYGYIELGPRLPFRRGMKLFAVRSYKEKPDAPTARRFVKSQRYLWNGCLFFWSAATILGGIRDHLPELARRLGRTARGPASAERAIDLLYRRLEPVSIEHGVVEKLDRLVVLAGDCGWEDVGTWGALAQLLPADPAGNVVRGLHLGIDSRDSLVLAGDGLVVTVGVRDLIVVKDGDAVLILPRDREGEMRAVVERLEADRRFRRFL